jgi:hypothetical protein
MERSVVDKACCLDRFDFIGKEEKKVAESIIALFEEKELTINAATYVLDLCAEALKFTCLCKRKEP